MDFSEINCFQSKTFFGDIPVRWFLPVNSITSLRIDGSNFIVLFEAGLVCYYNFMLKSFYFFKLGYKLGC